MGILIDCVRVSNFRAIKNLEVHLSPLTMLVGANNAGKTSFLRALHLALGQDRKVVAREDIHDDGVTDPDTLEILIDVRIVSVDEHGERMKEFEDLWGMSDDLSDRLKQDVDGFWFMGLRTRCKYDPLAQVYKIERKILKVWEEFGNWTDVSIEDKGNAGYMESIPLIFVDAQRDIQLDMRDRTSFLGKLTQKPEIDAAKIADIEKSINDLNNEIVAGSPKLAKLKLKLEELNKMMNSGGDGVSIEPMNRKVRDIGRNLNINFKETGSESFPMEYHGMGTRSWASLLTLNAFLSWQEENYQPYFPLLALEEPEAHLHPNAQRQLYKQLEGINGQKIISTHSPFVAAQCDLMNLRHFYREGNMLKVGQLEFAEKYVRMIGELLQEINDQGNTEAIKRELCPRIQELKIKKRDKITNEEKRKIERNIMNTRGEALFSKVLVFFEGETEEQALPIFATEKFERYPFELGINFIGVGGKDNYKPFLTFAKFLNIPWYILSDGDGSTEALVRKSIRDTIGVPSDDRLFVLDEYDIEEYLIVNGYAPFIERAINNIEKKDDYLSDFIELHNNHASGKDEQGNNIIRNYKNDQDGGRSRALLDCMRGDKTKYATAIAVEICRNLEPDGQLQLPTKVDDLLKKIAADIQYTFDDEPQSTDNPA